MKLRSNLLRQFKPATAREALLLSLSFFILSLPLLWPLAATGLSAGQDTAYHLQRTYELQMGLAEGSSYPRWAPFFAVGYGFPFFNFYAPFSYYLSLLPHAGGLSVADSYRVLFSLIPTATALAMYVFAREFFARHSAFLAALAYMYLPVQVAEIYNKSGLSESIGFVLLPLTLRAFIRLWQRGERRDFVSSAALMALALLTHNVLSLLTLATLVAYGVAMLPWQAWRSWPRRLLLLAGERRGARDTRLRLARLLGALSLGLGLAAFFWLPAFVERSYLGFEQLASGFFRPTYHFKVTWPAVQSTLLYDFQYSWLLGFTQVALASAGSVVGFWLPGRRRLAALCAAILAASIFLLSPASAFIWDGVPLLASFQYPWRVLPVTGLATSLLIGFLPLAGLERAWRTRAAGAVLLAGIVIGSVVGGYRPLPLGEPDYGAGAIERMASLAGWRLPPKEIGLPSGGPVADAVRVKRWGVQSIDLEVAASMPTLLVVHLQRFPGWRATVDGQPTATVPVGPYALTGIAVPAGQSQVSLSFGDTPLRQRASVVSVLSLIALVVAGGWPLRRRVCVPSLLTVLGVLLVAALLFVPWGRTVRAWRPAIGDAGITAMEPNLDLGPLRLLRAELAPSTVQPGQHEVTLYWQQRQPAPQLDVLVYAFDDVGAVPARAVAGPVGGSYPTDRWEAGEVVRDRIDLSLRSAPTALKIGLAGPDGLSLGSFYWPISAAQPPVALLQDVGASFGDRLELVAAAVDRRAVLPGQVLRVETNWQRRPALPAARPLGAFVHLVDSGGNMVAQSDWPLSEGKYPPAHWDSGETVRQLRELVVPATAAPGRYQLLAGIYTYPGHERLTLASGQTSASLGPLAVLGPAVRLGQEARPSRPLDVSFPAGQVTLVGYDQQRAGDRLAVDLYWRAAAPPPEDLVVFVHLLDAAGRLAAQHDGEPAGGIYPTSLWASGDYVRDSHQVDVTGLAAGQYRLVAGLYRRSDLQRLANASGRPDHSVDLGPVALGE